MTSSPMPSALSCVARDAEVYRQALKFALSHFRRTGDRWVDFMGRTVEPPRDIALAIESTQREIDLVAEHAG